MAACWDQCAVFILYSKISTDPGLLKIRHSHRFVAVVIQILITLAEIARLEPFTWQKATLASRVPKASRQGAPGRRATLSSM